MRGYFAPAIAIAMIMPAILSARSDDIPTLDVNPVCHGIAMQGELEAGLQQVSFEQCVKSEQEVREDIKKEWSTFSTADKSHCVALAKTGGESSYTELITCMEMARDVENYAKMLTACPSRTYHPRRWVIASRCHDSLLTVRWHSPRVPSGAWGPWYDGMK
jgi:hypothetical protein